MSIREMMAKEMSLSLLLNTKRSAFLRWMGRTNFWPEALCQQYLQIVRIMEYFIWYLSWGRTSIIHWSIHTARASIEIPMSSDQIYFLREFIKLKFRIFAGYETILQQISVLSARLGAESNCNLVSVISSEKRSQWYCCIWDGESFSAKWYYQGNEIATNSSWVEWWGS